MNRDDGGAILGAFLLGGLIGAAVALMTAPKSGAETREDVFRWTEGAATKTRDKVRKVTGEGSERVRSFASVASERVRGAAAETSEKVKGYVDTAREKLSCPTDEEPEGEGEQA